MYLTAGESTPYKSRSKCSIVKFGGGFSTIQVGWCQL